MFISIEAATCSALGMVIQVIRVSRKHLKRQGSKNYVRQNPTVDIIHNVLRQHKCNFSEMTKMTHFDRASPKIVWNYLICIIFSFKIQTASTLPSVHKLSRFQHQLFRSSALTAAVDEALATNLQMAKKCALRLQRRCRYSCKLSLLRWDYEIRRDESVALPKDQIRGLCTDACEVDSPNVMQLPGDTP